MAGPQSISVEELLYFKGLRILHTAIAPELRKLFKSLWEQRHKGNPWQDNQTSGESFFNGYKPKSPNRRYDDMIKTGNVEDWDMTVLCRAFIEYSLMKVIDSKYSDGVSILRKLRNKYAHNTSLRCPRSEYENDMRQVKKVFKDMGLHENTLTCAETIEPGDLERRELLREMEILRQELECRKELLNKLSEDDQKIHEELQSLTQDQKETREELLNKLTSTGREIINELHTLMKEHPTVSNREEPGGDGKPDQKDLPEWFQNVSPDLQQLVVTDKLIGRIAPHIGSDWEVIAMEMNIPKPKREAIIDRNQGSIQLQIIAAISKWKQKTSHKATIASLMRILWACNDRCTIGWDDIEAEVTKRDW